MAQTITIEQVKHLASIKNNGDDMAAMRVPSKNLGVVSQTFILHKLIHYFNLKEITSYKNIIRKKNCQNKMLPTTRLFGLQAYLTGQSSNFAFCSVWE